MCADGCACMLNGRDDLSINVAVELLGTFVGASMFVTQSDVTSRYTLDSMFQVREDNICSPCTCLGAAVALSY